MREQTLIISPSELLDGLSVSVLLLDAKSSVIRFVNRQCTTLLARSAADLVGRPLAALSSPDERSIAQGCEQAVATGVNPARIEAQLQKGDGSFVLVSVALNRVGGKERQPCWIAATLQEIGARRIMEQQLASAEAAAGMVTWYWDAIKDEVITSSYPSFKGVVLAPAFSFERMLEYVHPEDRNAVKRTINRALQTGAGYSHEYRVVTKDGTIRWMRGVAKCLFDSKGKVSHLVGVTIDITDVKELQAVRQVPKAIQAILREIDDNWNKPIRLSTLVRRHGVGARAVQRYFASRGMTSLSKHVKQIRLRHAHQNLAHPKPSTTVTAVALYCGFQNPGQFSREYRAEFGELPSETLRRALASPES